jgi:ribosomal-protein-alanine N-acetyltransferase
MIRFASIEDLDAIVELEKQFGAEAFSKRSLRHFICSNNIVYVIEFGDIIVGYLIALIRKDTSKVRLYSLMIDSNHRGKGYAIEILQFLERRCKELGKSEIGLEVSEGNYPAIALYSSLGFERGTERIENYYRDGTAALKFSKKL